MSFSICCVCTFEQEFHILYIHMCFNIIFYKYMALLINLKIATTTALMCVYTKLACLSRIVYVHE